MKVKRYIVTPDKHFPLADMKAISVVCQAIEIIKPDGYIDLGDTGEWASVSRFQYKNKKQPPLEIQLPIICKEVEEVNKGMDIIDESLNRAKVKDRHFVQGNHEEWLNNFVEEHPYLAKDFLVPNALKLKKRGYKFHKLGKMLKIGKLNFYHGHHYASVHHARNHLIRLGGNVMYGHHHDIQQSSVTHIDGVKSAWSIGCLKDMGSEANGWLGNKQHNWQHAFAIVDFYHSGFFTVHVVQIVNGRTSLWGQVIKG
ncbi:hypothetical protein N9987_00250 [bacterium]|nr:hypothetical protein [bacterium]